MNLLLFTAGAAEMYCGSCLRDNALAAELIKRGHKTLLVPLYTPTRTDEANVSASRVFFGGVSVYLEETVPMFRHTPSWTDWVWDRPGFIKRVAARSVATDPRRLGALAVSMLKGEDGHQQKEFEKLIGWLKTEPPPELAVLPNALLISLAAPLKRALGRPICCTLQGEDLFLQGLPEPFRGESQALVRKQVGDVDLFIAVSDYYARFMTDYFGIPASKIRVVPLGVAVDDFPARTGGRGRPFTVGFFGRIAPEKGLDRLAGAYVRLRKDGRLPEARLEAAGYLGSEHRGFLADIGARMRAAGLAGEFTYRGELDRASKVRFLQGLDVFSLPTPYHEPKGLSLLEALACGVPAVQPRTGAFPEIMARTEGGLLVDPDNEAALADGIFTIFGRPDEADRLGRQGAAGVRAHYCVEAMADRAEAAYRDVITGVQVNPPVAATA